MQMVKGILWTEQIIYDFNISWWMNVLKFSIEASLIKVKKKVLEDRCDISERLLSVITLSDGVCLLNICSKVNFNVLGTW